MAFKSLLLVFLGGGFGSMLRYAIGKFLNDQYWMPFGTFLVNMLGSLFIGLILGWALKNVNTSENITLLLAVGFCGGFTTFSAFAYENLNLLKAGNYSAFAFYSIGSLLIGIAAVAIGIWLSKLF